MKITFSRETYEKLLAEANKQDKPMATLINEVLIDYVNNKTYITRDNEEEEQPE